jgi:ribonuclease HII
MFLLRADCEPVPCLLRGQSLLFACLLAGAWPCRPSTPSPLAQRLRSAIQGHEEVDQLNILGATLRAMVQAAAALGTADTRIPVQAESADVLCNGTPPCLGVLAGGLLGVQPTMILVDGNRLPPGGFEGGVPARSVVKGDARVACIAAASILAKVRTWGPLRGGGGGGPPPRGGARPPPRPPPASGQVTRDRQMKQYGLLYPGYGFEQHKGYGVPAHAEALRRLGPCPIHRRSFEPIKSMVGWSRPPALQPTKARLPLQPKPAQLVEEQQLAEGRATARRSRAGH